MNVLIALLDCRQERNGPWMRPRGVERGAALRPLPGPGECVEIEMERRSSTKLLPLIAAFTPLDLAGVVRYRVNKRVNGQGPQTTTNVEIVLE